MLFEILRPTIAIAMIIGGGWIYQNPEKVLYWLKRGR